MTTKYNSNKKTLSSSNSSNIFEDQQKVIQNLTQSLMVIPNLLHKFTLDCNADQSRKLLIELFKKPTFIEKLKNAFEEGMNQLDEEKKKKLRQFLDNIKNEITDTNNEISRFAGLQTGNTIWTTASGICTALPPCNYIVLLINNLRLLNKALILSAEGVSQGNKLFHKISKLDNLKDLEDIITPVINVIKKITDEFENIDRKTRDSIKNVVNDKEKALNTIKPDYMVPDIKNIKGGKRKSKKKTRYMKSKLRQHINKISRRTDLSIKRFLNKRHKIRKTRHY